MQFNKESLYKTLKDFCKEDVDPISMTFYENEEFNTKNDESTGCNGTDHLMITVVYESDEQLQHFANMLANKCVN